MKKPAAPIFPPILLRTTTLLLLLCALAAALVACGGGSAPPATALTAEPPPGDSPRPTIAVVSASNVATSAPASRSERPPAGLSATPAPTALAPGATPAASAAITSEQIVAAFEDVLSNIYEKALPSVVYIQVPSPAAEALRGMPGIPDDLLWSAGSGFVWDTQGHIVTNHHVVENVIDQSNEVTVIFADSTQATATVVGGDPHSDLAVIKLEQGDWNLQPATLGDSNQVNVGQLAVAIGAPFGQEFTMTSGIVSAVGRNIMGQEQFSIPEVIQTDSAINPGNSGGPLLDRLGRVIGINTQIISRTGNYSGVGMAVPVNIARRVVPALIADGKFSYPWLGITIATIDAAYAKELDLPEGSRGALIGYIVDGSPADKAGFRSSESTISIDGIEYPAGGDIITAIGPNAVTGFSDLIAHLTYHNSPGDTVTFTILRDGKQQEIEATLGRRPE